MKLMHPFGRQKCDTAENNDDARVMIPMCHLCFIGDTKRGYLILKLSIFHFKMVMFLALHPMESISLNSFVLLEHLAILLTSTFAIKC